MLSYRHGFHAGNFADVLKHLVLIALLDYLNRKDTPYCVIDTHAGAGMYPLSHAYMQKNREYQTGIGKLFDRETTDPLLARYLSVIRTFNPQGLTQYPGSPKIAQSVSRETARLQFIERHPADAEMLQSLFYRSPRAKVFHLDAAKAVVSFLPPKEKRGLIFMDPSYELDSEYSALLHLLKVAHERFPSGMYALWYPVIDRRQTDLFIRKLAALPFAEGLRIEHCPHPDGIGHGMTGSGMVIFNPPYTLKADITPTLKILNSTLGSATGTYRATAMDMGPKPLFKGTSV